MSFFCYWLRHPHCLSFFFFNDTATTEIYTLSLHDALPISERDPPRGRPDLRPRRAGQGRRSGRPDRKSTRLNSSHQIISYAVFCLKKKKKEQPLFRAKNYESVARR